ACLIAQALERMGIRTRLAYEFLPLRDAFYCCFLARDVRLNGAQLLHLHDAVVTNPPAVPDAFIEQALANYGPSETLDDAMRLRVAGRAGSVQPTLAGVRHTLDGMRACVHIPLTDETQVLAERSGYLAWTRPEEDERHLTIFPYDPQGPHDGEHPDAVMVTDHQILTRWFNWERRGLPRRWLPTSSDVYRWVDATRLVMTCFDPTDQYLLLIDDRLRTIGMNWGTVAAHPALRAELEHFGIWNLPRGSFGNIQ
ncbi:hypothetical protein, partial [Actinomyces sp. MRS3W]|uniref:hypothetical protein n=1 Tax=Actinomyces sp. MRS3W TaxID=2800796 RepID=UPI0028FDC31A